MFEKFRKTKLQKRAQKKVVKERSMLWKQVFVGMGIVVALSLLVTAIWYGTRIESLQITQVEVVGGYTIPHNEIEDTVRQVLMGEYFKLVPHTFRATYPKKAILESIQGISRMKNVQVEVIETRMIVVLFEEYRPYALWCVDALAEECLFLDEFGYAFSKAPVLTGSAFVRYIESDVIPEVHAQAFETDFVKMSQEFADRLASELDLYVTHIEKIDKQDVHYTVSGGGVLKLSQTMSLDQSFKNLRSILGSENFIHLQNGAFQYIDLRFGDKIFLNEEEEKENVATSTEDDNL